MFGEKINLVHSGLSTFNFFMLIYNVACVRVTLYILNIFMKDFNTEFKFVFLVIKILECISQLELAQLIGTG